MPRRNSQPLGGASARHVALTLILALSSLAVSLCRASVIGVDIGADWLKVSIVKPGVPLDIVLNRESKRKTSSMITIRDGVRFFGSDSVSLSSRFPELTFPNIKKLIGQPFDSPAASQYRALFANNMIEVPDRGTCAFRLGYTDSEFSLEELLAMQLAHAKQQAEIFGNEDVSGAVITVPAFFTQVERQAILDAAEIANLRVLNLMNQGTAVALNYAMNNVMTRTIKTPEYHIFYDMGATSTSATLVKFHTAKVKDSVKKTKTIDVPEAEVLAVGFDATLGGQALDFGLRDLLAEERPKSIWDSPRAMMRLWKEANRVKQILSANQETISSVEGLHEDIDFKVKITRAQLEAVAADLVGRVATPIKDAIAKTNLTLDDINSLVLVGGGIRVPAIQAALKDLMGDNKLAQNVNQDEAAVLGAGFRAASISTQFRAREIRIKDISSQPIEIAYEMDPRAGSTEGKVLHTVLFAENSQIGTKKLMNFKRTSDFSFDVSYKSSKDPILSAVVTGLTDEIKKFSTSEPPAVKASIDLTDSSMVVISDATAVFEVDQSKADSPSLKDTVLSFFGGGKKKESEDASEDSTPSEEIKIPDEKANATAKDGKDGKDAASSKKVTTEKVKLKLEVKPFKALSAESKSASKERFAKMDAQDAARRAREEAFNSLESFIYSSKDFLTTDDVEAVTTTEQRDGFATKISEAQDWLDEHGGSASLEELRRSLKTLKDAHAPILFRRDELRGRAEAFANFYNTTGTYASLISALRGNLTAPVASPDSSDKDSSSEAPATPIVSPIESAEFDRVLKSVADAEARQVVTIKEMELKKAELDMEVMKMFSRPTRRPQQPKKPAKKPAGGDGAKGDGKSAGDATATASATETATETATATEEAGAPAGEATEPVADGPDAGEATDVPKKAEGHSEL
ncbi:Hsp70 protein-domain-containing protein [Zopfochytrium polystomum]|nr:Hsp70 protein-domain-containing protein [Zopfochytrium polystomum]